MNYLGTRNLTMTKTRSHMRKALGAHLAGWRAHYSCRSSRAEPADATVQRTSERAGSDVVDLANRALFALVASSRVMKTTTDALCNGTFDTLQGAAQAVAALEATQGSPSTPIVLDEPADSVAERALDAMDAVVRLRAEVHRLEARIAAHIAATSEAIDLLTASLNRRRFEAFRTVLLGAAKREPLALSELPECYLCTETVKEPAWIAPAGCAHPPLICCLDCLARASFSLFRDGRADEAACPHCRAPFALSDIRLSQ